MRGICKFYVKENLFLRNKDIYGKLLAFTEDVKMSFIKNLIAGAIIGIANIIPGVSGGTMMVILNVFDKIVDAISHFTKAVKKNLLYLLPILLGAAIGILAFSKGITFMLDYYPMITNFFFHRLDYRQCSSCVSFRFSEDGWKN